MWHPSWGRSNWNSTMIFGIKKLESLGIICAILDLAVSIQLWLLMDRHTAIVYTTSPGKISQTLRNFKNFYSLPTGFPSKWHLYPFINFCTIYRRDEQTDRHRPRHNNDSSHSSTSSTTSTGAGTIKKHSLCQVAKESEYLIHHLVTDNGRFFFAVGCQRQWRHIIKCCPNHDKQTISD